MSTDSDGRCTAPGLLLADVDAHVVDGDWLLNIAYREDVPNSTEHRLFARAAGLDLAESVTLRAVALDGGVATALIRVRLTIQLRSDE